MSEYADRNEINLGEHYVKHVIAMTREGLHAKSAIAAELAFRDAEIERLYAKNEELKRERDRLLELSDSYIDGFEDGFAIAQSSDEQGIEEALNEVRSGRRDGC